MHATTDNLFHVGIHMIYFNQALSQMTYNDGYIRGDHPTNPGTEGADSHC